MNRRELVESCTSDLQEYWVLWPGIETGHVEVKASVVNISYLLHLYPPRSPPCTPSHTQGMLALLILIFLRRLAVRTQDSFDCAACECSLCWVCFEPPPVPSLRAESNVHFKQARSEAEVRLPRCENPRRAEHILLVSGRGIRNTHPGVKVILSLRPAAQPR